MSVFKIHHITRYLYERPVSESVNEIRLFPYQSPEQEILQHEMKISQNPDIHIFKDYWGNKAATFTIAEPHNELVIESKLVVRVKNNGNLSPDVTSATFQSLKEETKNSIRLFELTKSDPIDRQLEIDKICSRFYKPEKNVAEVVRKCNEYVFNHFTYTRGITTVETTVDEILDHKSGVCQDFAHVLLQILRTLEIPSRYVSGYICPNKNGMRGEGATHAWVEVWIPGFGWAGIDPTNNVWVINQHVKLAVGRNFTDCSVVKGSFRGPSEQDLYVLVSVGYEDGHTFEEVTHVQTGKQPSKNNTEKRDRVNEAAQQQ